MPFYRTNLAEPEISELTAPGISRKSSGLEVFCTEQLKKSRYSLSGFLNRIEIKVLLVTTAFSAL